MYKRQIQDRKTDQTESLRTAQHTKVDEVSDFRIGAGDKLDLSDVARQLGFDGAEMQPHIILGLSGVNSTLVSVHALGRVHDVILIHGLKPATLEKAQPWIFDAPAADHENVMPPATSLEMQPAVTDDDAALASPLPMPEALDLPGDGFIFSAFPPTEMRQDLSLIHI